MISAPSQFADTQQVLSAIAARTPRAARRAGAALAHILRDIESSRCPEYAWTASRLTGDGYPVEFTFTSRDEVVRYTVAPWPDEPVHARLGLACELICELGGQRVPASVADALRPLTAGLDEPSYGAWIGGRHEDAATTRDRFKLYVQAAPGARPEVELASDPQPILHDREIELRLYAYEPASDVHERYFRVRRLHPHHLRPLLRCAGLAHRTDELVELIRRSYGHPIDDAIPGGSVGFSLAGPIGGPTVFTLYVFARALWGGDRRIRRALAELAAARGWELSAYQQASAPLADRDVHSTYHAMTGFVIDADGSIDVTVGLRPPPLPFA